MHLNPMRAGLSRLGQQTAHHQSPFQADADTALAGFRNIRDDLERRVRRGDLTRRVAREQAAESAAALRRDLLKKCESYSPTPRAFLDRLVEASQTRERTRETQSLEGLQRETN